MLATLLLLAQLVLPGPPSGPIQPPGMICLGECAGPVVWGPAERGRLVVACDMTSDTCSDGRKITTTRATPVPCEVSPGVWEMVPEDTGCYSVRGLEAWAQNTSYLSWGAELDRSPWGPINGATFEVLPDGYRIHPAAGRANSGLTQAGLVAVPAGGESRTLACIVRTHQPAYLRYWVSSAQSVSFPAVDTGGRWEVVAGTREVSEGLSATILVGNGPATESPIPFDVKACWLTRTSTPGRPCWGGEAPVTCAADRHTISTEGWPTEAGEVCIRFGFDHASSANRYLLDSREGGEGVSLHLSGERIVGRTYHQGSQVSITGPSVPIGTHIACLEWDATTLRLRFDGQLIGESPHTPPASHRAAATVGYDTGGGSYFNGSIRSLTVRSYKEVSP